MRRARIILLLAATAGLGFSPGVAAVSRWETLQAIHLVENPTNRTSYGPRGELGPYQFRADTWRLHTNKPFRMALDRASSDEVAVQHYEWIKQGLAEAGIDANTYNIALAWNCGLGAVVNGRVPGVTYRYASQVSNLAEMIARQTREGEKTPALAAAAARPSVFPSLPAVPAFSLAAVPLKVEIAGQTPRYVVRMGEPEISAVVRTEPETPVPGTLQVADTVSTKPATARFVLATLD